MTRAILVLVGLFVAGALLISPPQKAWNTKPQQHEQQPAPATAPNQSRASQRQEGGGCPGTRHPDTPCAAISANADEEQADSGWANLGANVVTAVVAFFAAVFAALAAKWGRRTVEAFIEVERADIALTLENFREEDSGGTTHPHLMGGTYVPKSTSVFFDICANNIGRSTALITQVSAAWCVTPHPMPELSASPKEPVIVSVSSSKIIHSTQKLIWREQDNPPSPPLPLLRDERFLWVMISYRSPLRDGERCVASCFEVSGLRGTVRYQEWIREESDKKSRKAKPPPPFGFYWPRPRG